MKNFYKEYFHIAKGEKIRDKVILTRMVSSIVVTLFCLVGISLTAYAYFYHNISSGLNIMSSAHFEVEVSVSAQIPEAPDAESNDEENGQTGENSEGAESSEGAGMEEPQDDFLTEGSENADTGEPDAQTEGDVQAEPEVQTEGDTQTEGTPENQAEGEGEAQASIAEETQTDEGMPEEINEEESSESTIPPEAYSPQLVRLNKKTHTVYLYPGVVYEITLTRSGDAKTGYCHIEAAGCSDVYITGQIGKDGEYTDDTLSFFITVNAGTTVKIVSNWGTSSAYDAYINHNPSDFYVLDGNTVNILLPITKEQTPEAEENNESDITKSDNGEIIHTVSDGEFLFLIAERYGVSVERIAAYNEISDPSVIYTGDIITIPPADWVMPEISIEGSGDSEGAPTEETPVEIPGVEGEAESDNGAETPEEAPNTEGGAEGSTDTEMPDETPNTEGEAEGSTDAEIPDETPNTEGEKDIDASDESTDTEGKTESDTEAEVSGESSDSESDAAEETEPSQT